MGVVGVVGEVGEVRVVGVGEGREVTQHIQFTELHNRTLKVCVHSNSTITCVYFYILHLVIRVQS